LPLFDCLISNTKIRLILLYFQIYFNFFIKFSEGTDQGPQGIIVWQLPNKFRILISADQGKQKSPTISDEGYRY
jgi:hypothetical protein